MVLSSLRSEPWIINPEACVNLSGGGGAVGAGVSIRQEAARRRGGSDSRADLGSSVVCENEFPPAGPVVIRLSGGEPPEGCWGKR